jgi:polyvinyl alcohol dehydrogenase (cytochrome)
MSRVRGRRTVLAAAVAAFLLLLATPGSAAVPADWSAYLFGTEHSSFNAAATAITPANVGAMSLYWQWHPAGPTQAGQPSAGLFSSPVTVGGRVYIGSGTGDFYALDLATRTVVWRKFVGFVRKTTCGGRGFTSTATVVPDPTRGGQLTVYVAAGDGYLYALRASDGETVWRSVVAIPSTTQNDYYNWGSPTVRDGKIWMGISSQCDAPLVRAGVRGYDQASGTLLGTYFSVPAGARGGSVWSSVAVNAADQVFASTGNGPKGTDAASIVRIDGTTMARQDGFRVPASDVSADDDFGASPTLFTATLGGVQVPMVGACNKNGRFYALRQQNLAAGPVWKLVAARPTPDAEVACLTAPIWDGSRLFLAATGTTIGGKQFAGPIRRLNPSTGAVIWARGFPKGIIGSPTLDGSGVIAAGTWDSNGPDVVYLINSATGAVLRTIAVGSYQVWGQPVFADNYLLIATTGPTGLIVYRV